MRVKRGTTHVKRRKNLLKRVKGYRWGRKKTIKLGKTAAVHAGVHAYRSRRLKKRDARNLWTIRINAAARLHGTTYSHLIDALKKSHIDLDRKILSTLAKDHPKLFAEVVKKAQGK